MGESVNIYQRQREFHLFVASKFSDLLGFKKEGDVSSFNNILLKAMPAVKRYIQKNLNRALATNKMDKNKYRADDFIDQLFIEVYDHIDEIKNEKELHLWMFKKVDELLGDIMVEEEFDSIFFENIDNYSKPEWDAMQEKFSTDGDGDLVMTEELDDISYAKNDYILNHVFVEDNDQKMMDQLDKELDVENIRKHSEMVLHQLPIPMQKVYELFTEHQFDVAEIAKIRKSTIKEVESILEAARKSLRTSFLKRYVG
ncbi:sigma-70 family RNA polymerase sigma factor [Arenibacter sp. TNZ]|jgi:DNA-directed RNA polymerase specialized sigma24 family protein|uniref:sigma-70 family RNA polymerase sigma factor n=1 Tax=Arenibacter TaxID=178469 RepID=UPI000CD40B80|nr:MULTISPECIES: sigma-70 family RNA polymerase sigma factor [Arenibacter]MCM4173314.1 sigma-70 family RNA polymerase sigma factor [Arenibacter sp. TNZ]